MEPVAKLCGVSYSVTFGKPFGLNLDSFPETRSFVYYSSRLISQSAQLSFEPQLLPNRSLATQTASTSRTPALTVPRLSLNLGACSRSLENFKTGIPVNRNIMMSNLRY